MLSAYKLKSLWNPIKTCVRHYPYSSGFLQFLRNQPPTTVSSLDNGLRIASECRRGPEVCVGLFMDAGSRYENATDNGIAHFFEHIAFTTTKSRTREALLEQMNCTGAKFGCFTTREMVAYYAECLPEDLQLVIDILADCVFNNAYNEEDIQKQKPVVYEEYIMTDQNPSNVMFDYLHATAYQGTPLAQSVIGPSSNLNSFNPGSIFRYTSKYFVPYRTVLAASGGVEHETLEKFAKLYMGHLQCVKCHDRDIYRYTGSEVRYRQDGLPFANIAYAVEGPSFCDDQRTVIDIAVSMMSGWDVDQFAGVNHGVSMARTACCGQFCDAYKAFAIYYKNASLWGVHFLSTSLQQEDMLFTVQDHLLKMSLITTDPELQRAKRHEKTKLLSKTESSKGSCFDIGRYILYNGERPTLWDRVCAIDYVTVNQFKKVMENYIYDKCPVVSAVGPCEGLPDYLRIRAHTWWMRL